MKTPVLILILLIFGSSVTLAQSDISSRCMITVEVKNIFKTPVPGAEVYYCNSATCDTKKTDQNGKAVFKVSELPSVIVAFDPSGKYGLQSMKINYSAVIYTVELPFRPQNVHEAGAQMDNVLNQVSALYGYVSAARFIKENLDAVKAGNVVSKGLPKVGVPGVFSVNPIPVIGSDGRLGLNVSGLLVEKINGIWKLTQPFQGMYSYYQHTGAY